MSKKIVFVINYFYPDPASTGQLLTDLCLNLQGKFQITVIAALPGGYTGNTVYSSKKIFQTDTLQNIRIVRLKLPKLNKFSKFSRVKYIFTYFVLANIAVIREKSVDIIYTISTPPILGGLIGTIEKYLKHAKHVYNIQDFNPEQAEAIHYSKHHLIYLIARALDNFNCKHSDEIVVVGHDMVGTLKQRFKHKEIPRYQVINNWTDEDEIVPLQKSEKHVANFLDKNYLTGKFIVMYSGNIGLYYDLENLIKITKQFSNNDNLVFVFIGEGAMKDKLQNYIACEKIRNTVFLPYQSKKLIRYSLNAADVHLVVSQKGIKGVSVPSKIYGVMAAGKPVLGVVEKGSEVERLITASSCGRYVEPNDYNGVIRLINFFYLMDKTKKEKMGMNGRHYLDCHLRKDLSIKKYEDLLQNL